MPIIEWNDSMSVGVSLFDEHHKKLIDYINQLYDAMKNGKGRDITGPIVKNLYDYAVFHFGIEEEEMAKINYPKLEEQKSEHKYFVEKVKEFSERINSQDILISTDLLDFLSDWLKKHILKNDMEYKPYFNK